MAILDYFPQTANIRQPRPTQLELLPQIEAKIRSGSKRIIVVAPAGAGKSPDAFCSMDWFCTENTVKGLYTSPLNSLVDQVNESFFELGVRTLKGRANYPCKAKEHKQMCDSGYCQSETCTHEKAIKSKDRKITEVLRDCKNLPYKECRTCECRECWYKKIKAQFKAAKIANTNFTLFSFGMTNEPEIIIIDESDEIEGTIRNDKTVIIKEAWGAQTWKDYLMLLGEYLQELELESSDKEGRPKPKIIRKMKAVSNIISDYANNSEEWNVKLKQDSICFEPVTINRFLEPLFKNKTVIMMSATPEKLPGWDVLEVGSEIPAWAVPWQYKPLGKMTLNNGIYEGSHREKTIPKICDFIVRLEGKSLVHCGSYATASLMASFMRENFGIYPLQQTQENHDYFENLENDTVKRYEIINAFKKSKDMNQIALTVNMGRGIDCPEPEICNSVIACMPQFNPTESLVRAKIRLLGRGWMDTVKSNDIMQSDSRIKRGIIKYHDVVRARPDLDWLPNQDGLIIKKSWVLDSNFDVGSAAQHGKWFSTHRDLFYDWFLQREVKS